MMVFMLTSNPHERLETDSQTYTRHIGIHIEQCLTGEQQTVKAIGTFCDQYHEIVFPLIIRNELIQPSTLSFVRGPYLACQEISRKILTRLQNRSLADIQKKKLLNPKDSDGRCLGCIHIQEIFFEIAYALQNRLSDLQIHINSAYLDKEQRRLTVTRGMDHLSLLIDTQYSSGHEIYHLLEIENFTIGEQNLKNSEVLTVGQLFDLFALKSNIDRIMEKETRQRFQSLLILALTGNFFLNSLKVIGPQEKVLLKTGMDDSSKIHGPTPEMQKWSSLYHIHCGVYDKADMENFIELN